jgi:hypothetical protein
MEDSNLASPEPGVGGELAVLNWPGGGFEAMFTPEGQGSFNKRAPIRGDDELNSFFKALRLPDGCVLSAWTTLGAAGGWNLRHATLSAAVLRKYDLI